MKIKLFFKGFQDKEGNILGWHPCYDGFELHSGTVFSFDIDLEQEDINALKNAQKDGFLPLFGFHELEEDKHEKNSQN